MKNGGFTVREDVCSEVIPLNYRSKKFGVKSETKGEAVFKSKTSISNCLL